MGRLEGKVAIITGAGSGIGKETSKLFAHEGAKVVLVDVSEAAGLSVLKEIRSDGGTGEFVSADVTSSSDCKRMVDFSVKKYGGLDILFNNAGIGIFGDVTTLTEEEWDKELAVNLKGVFLGSKYAVPEMRKRGGGSIINTASGAGLIGTPSSVAYCASKGGVVLLTKAMALDHARDKIRVNAVAPGVVDTPFNDRILQSQADPTAARKATEQVIPLGRLATPLDVAYAALFLASDESSFITGAVLSVDGGYTAQ
ncbi:MAG TPA: SDR family oxidoreductase [Bacillota bacterium]|nr:SDR family oxidoreductase [Bacillota bacterium]